jgi:hypothetical protein
MGKTMKAKRIPETDSIDELARFWDTHDLTEFEDQLEEVPEREFQGEAGAHVALHLNATELESLRRLAEERELEEASLVREWVVEKLDPS